ncbi:hypothetical protein IscW_ISCW005134, partial [Ixodes scapularis]
LAFECMYVAEGIFELFRTEEEALNIERLHNLHCAWPGRRFLVFPVISSFTVGSSSTSCVTMSSSV